LKAGDVLLPLGGTWRGMVFHTHECGRYPTFLCPLLFSGVQIDISFIFATSTLIYTEMSRAMNGRDRCRFIIQLGDAAFFGVGDQLFFLP
jgi:hypothetical protein